MDKSILRSRFFPQLFFFVCSLISVHGKMLTEASVLHVVYSSLLINIGSLYPYTFAASRASLMASSVQKRFPSSLSHPAINLLPCHNLMLYLYLWLNQGGHNPLVSPRGYSCLIISYSFFTKGVTSLDIFLSSDEEILISERFLKARLVAKGFRQRAGENFFQTFQ